MKLSDLRANDLVIKRLLQKIAAANIQNPDYTAIKEILENGADGRYAAAEATEEDIRAAQLNQDVPIKTGIRWKMNEEEGYKAAHCSACGRSYNLHGS